MRFMMIADLVRAILFAVDAHVRFITILAVLSPLIHDTAV